MNAAACTIVAKSFLWYARVLADSFLRHHAGIPFFVLLADEIEGCFDPASESFQLIALGDLSIPNAHRFRFGYPQQPLSYASTPYLLEHLLDRGFSRVLFFKQEGLVLDSHAEVLELLGRHPIAMTPHLLSPLESGDPIARELNVLQSGIFNVGLLGVSDHGAARRFLRWWQDRVFTHCLHAVADGMHYEQRWLDLVPGYFEGAHIIRDPGVNVGHWNLPDRRIDVEGSAVRVDGRPCRLFRFSGFDPDTPQRATRYSDRLTPEILGPAGEVFARYGRLLNAAGYQETRRWPYAYGRFDNGVAVADFMRHIYLRLGDAADAFGDPRDTTREGSYFDWLREPAAPGSPVTRLWQAVHAARPDLQAAFPDPLGADSPRFIAWTASSGTREHGIPDVFLPGCPS